MEAVEAVYLLEVGVLSESSILDEVDCRLWF